MVRTKLAVSGKLTSIDMKAQYLNFLLDYLAREHAIGGPLPSIPDEREMETVRKDVTKFKEGHVDDYKLVVTAVINTLPTFGTIALALLMLRMFLLLL